MRVRTWAVGVDFGGTFIKVGLVNTRGRVVSLRKLASRRYATPAVFVSGVRQAVTDLARVARLRVSQLAGVGVGAPGPVDQDRGIVRSCVNVSGWHNVPLRRALERALQMRCVVENDANLVGLGEWSFGAGQGARLMIGVTLGTGVGGSIIHQGDIFHGADGSAGELGHMGIHLRGPRCACGRRGCIEAFVGTHALLREGRRAMREGARTLRTLVRQNPTGLAPRLIGKAGRAGDRRAQAVWVALGRYLGIALADVVNLLNPDRIVIGGGIANNFGLFAPTLKKTLTAEAMDVPARAVRVVRAALGDHAGIVGGAVLVWRTGRRTRPRA